MFSIERTIKTIKKAGHSPDAFVKTLWKEVKHCVRPIEKQNEIKPMPKWVIQENRVVFLEKPECLKITGTRLGTLCAFDPFKTKFQLWCELTGLYTPPEIDPIYSKAGNAIEPKLREYVEKKKGIKFKSYDYDAVKGDVFHMPVFGGIPDGEPLINGSDELAYGKSVFDWILEIKTCSANKLQHVKDKTGAYRVVVNDSGVPLNKTKKLGTHKAEWIKNDCEWMVPMKYLWQVGLYCYLRKTTHALICVAFLDNKDYVHPENYDVETGDIHIIHYDINLLAFKEYIDQAKQWYIDHISKQCISPEMTERDWAWFRKEVMHG